MASSDMTHGVKTEVEGCGLEYGFLFQGFKRPVCTPRGEEGTSGSGTSLTSSLMCPWKEGEEARAGLQAPHSLTQFWPGFLIRLHQVTALEQVIALVKKKKYGLRGGLEDVYTCKGHAFGH